MLQIQKRYARVLTIAGILLAWSLIQAPTAQADAYFVSCCNSQNECNYGLCNDGNQILNYLMGRFSGACGTTVDAPSGSNKTCSYEAI